MARILIVDDAPMARSMLSFMLAKAGHQIAGMATNGMEALEMFGELHPDLVTMDIQMPVMDGITALQKIIQADPSARVVVISALDQDKMEGAALESGAAAYLSKPFGKEDLEGVVSRALAA